MNNTFFNMSHVSRPLICAMPMGKPLEEQGAMVGEPAASPVDLDAADEGLAVFNEPIVGFEKVGDHNLEVKRAKGLPSPKEPSASEVEQHNLTGHIKFESWCPFCVSCRKPNDHHRASASDRALPLIVADYCFLRDEGDTEGITVLVLKVYPYHLYLALVVDAKGLSDAVINKVA